jgi:hypothetical protein
MIVTLPSVQVQANVDRVYQRTLANPLTRW